MDPNSSSTFLGRHEFLIRRLHSLSGLIPVGAYMVVHLATNASVLDRPATYQKAVYQIHSLGSLLPIVEWGFIFLPILFHAILGVVIIRGGLPNSATYRLSGNVRYTLQRATGMIAFFFIVWHVFHMHGWFHFEGWRSAISGFGGKFRPYQAGSSLGEAMTSSFWIPLLYVLGVLSCVFHLANGLWTMGITWGVWTTPASQRRANWVCLVFGVGLAFVSLGAIVGAVTVDQDEALRSEERMVESRLAGDEIKVEDALHKGWTRDELVELLQKRGWSDDRIQQFLREKQELEGKGASANAPTDSKKESSS